MIDTYSWTVTDAGKDCSSLDLDGDGVAPNDGDCDDSDPLHTYELDWYTDEDSDGYSDNSDTLTSCTRPSVNHFKSDELI